jgi:hypothetical protein
MALSQPVEAIAGQSILQASTPLAIGAPWPGVGGAYAGIARGQDGEPDGHLVLLDDVPDSELAWQAALDWAAGLGNGAHVPTRLESALLYANLRDEFQTSGWYWTSSQDSAGYAWNQYFYGGTQSSNDMEYEARARAVRRFPA